MMMTLEQRHRLTRLCDKVAINIVGLKQDDGQPAILSDHVNQVLSFMETAVENALADSKKTGHKPRSINRAVTLLGEGFDLFGSMPWGPYHDRIALYRKRIVDFLKDETDNPVETK